MCEEQQKQNSPIVNGKGVWRDSSQEIHRIAVRVQKDAEHVSHLRNAN